MRPLFDKQDFIDFCRKKGHRQYKWDSITNCALAQYIMSRVGEDNFHSVGSDTWYGSDGKPHRVPKWAWQAACYPDGGKYTFNRVADKAEMESV